MLSKTFTQSTIKKLNRLFTKQNHYLDACSINIETAIKYNIKSGEVVYHQFDGFNDFKDKVILDFGCGFGGKSLFYGTLNVKEVIGVDIVNNFKRCQEFADKDLLPVKFATLKNNKLPLDDKSIDIVISSAVFEHIENVNEALDEIYRVLKPGGLFLLRWHPFRTRYGAHLDDAISIPFAHILFPEKDILKCYSELLADKYKNSEKILEMMQDEFYIDIFKEYASYKEFKTNNFLTVKEFAKKLEKTAFTIKKRTYLFGKKHVPIVSFVPESMKDYCIDYEIYVLQK